MIDLTGQICGYWKVTNQWERRTRPCGGQETYWLCVCSCGKSEPTWVLTASLISGNSKSCGCWKIEQASKRRKDTRVKDHPLYRIWRGIHDRCKNKNDPAYHRYGARGIKVCACWSDIRTFAEDVSPRPSPTHELHRRDNDKDYSPENVVWMTKKEHAMHHQGGKWITVDGIRDSICATAKRVGINDHSLITWMDRGFDPQEVVDQRRIKGQGKHIFRFLHVPDDASPERFKKIVQRLFDKI